MASTLNSVDGASGHKNSFVKRFSQRVISGHGLATSDFALYTMMIEKYYESQDLDLTFPKNRAQNLGSYYFASGDETLWLTCVAGNGS